MRTPPLDDAIGMRIADAAVALEARPDGIGDGALRPRPARASDRIDRVRSGAKRTMENLHA